MCKGNFIFSIGDRVRRRVDCRDAMWEEEYPHLASDVMTITMVSQSDVGQLISFQRASKTWNARNFDLIQRASELIAHSLTPPPMPPLYSRALTYDAATILEKAAGHMRDRAALRDTPSGERSMVKTVAMFNIYAGTELTEEQGWRFMEILKIVRSSQGAYCADDHEDATAYAALCGEAAAQANNK